MKKRFLCPQFVIKGALALVCVFSLLSFASVSVASYEEVLPGYFHNENKSFKVILTENIEISSLLFGQKISFPSTESREEVSKHLGKLSPLLLIAAGILAGFNPCLLAVIAFLASVTLAQQQGGRKEMLKMTLGFSTGIFTIHMLIGINILLLINIMPEIQEIFTSVTILLTAFLGLWHIFDAYWLKKHSRSTFKTPDSQKNFMSGMSNKNLLLLSFLSGGMYFLVKAPCLGAIYLSVLSILATKTTTMEGITYAGLYNLGLLLPITSLGLLLSFGLSPNKVTEFREKRRVVIRLATGVILIIIALMMQLKII